MGRRKEIGEGADILVFRKPCLVWGRHGPWRELREMEKQVQRQKLTCFSPQACPLPRQDRQTGMLRDLPREKRSAESFLLPLPCTVLFILNRILSFLEQESRVIHSVISTRGTQWGSVNGDGYRIVSGSTSARPRSACVSVSWCVCVSICTRAHTSEVSSPEHLNSTLSPFSFLPPPQETRGLEASAPG